MAFGIWETEPEGPTGSRSGLVRVQGYIARFSSRERAGAVAQWLTDNRAPSDGYKVWRAVELRDEEEPG